MKRWIWAIVVLLLIIGFIVYRQVSVKDIQPTFKTTVARTDTIRKIVSGTGNIEYTVNYSIIANQAGIVDRLNIKENTNIRTGQEILRISGEPLFILNGKTPIYRNLMNGNEGDDVKVLQNSLKELGYDIDETDGDFGSDTKRELKNLQDDKGRDETGVLNIINFQSFPLPLKVVDLSINQGDMATQGQTLATLANSRKLKASVLVNEIDIPQIKKGQIAAIEIDALPGKKFSGKVSVISDKAESSSTNQQSQSESSTSTTGVVNYMVEILMDKPSSEIKTGMTANADIIVKQKNNALIVSSAVVKERNGEKFVSILQDGRVIRKSVKTGITTESETEILSGIEKGDKIVVGFDNQSSQNNQGSQGGFMFRPPR